MHWHALAPHILGRIRKCMRDMDLNIQVHNAAAFAAISTKIESAVRTCEEETSKLDRDYYTAVAASSPAAAAKVPPSVSKGSKLPRANLAKMILLQQQRYHNYGCCFAMWSTYCCDSSTWSYTQVCCTNNMYRDVAVCLLHALPLRVLQACKMRLSTMNIPWQACVYSQAQHLVSRIHVSGLVV